ncbi:MAG: hypothetical protein HY738_05695 [Bacteroidia bacterium]|nr:hypothetical protein [Bacteroidia bacterium]
MKKLIYIIWFLPVLFIFSCSKPPDISVTWYYVKPGENGQQGDLLRLNLKADNSYYCLYAGSDWDDGYIDYGTWLQDDSKITLNSADSMTNKIFKNTNLFLHLQVNCCQIQILSEH